MNRRAWLAALLLILASSASTPAAPPVEFNRDIRPILADNCFACHGPDKNQRKADLRLDTQEGAFSDLGGYHALVPGKPEQSALYQRVSEPDPKHRMPPARFGKN